MAKIIAKNKQNLYNVALQVYGSFEGVFDIIKDNDISINITLFSGRELAIDEEKIIDLNVVRQYSKVDYIPNNGDFEQGGMGDFNEDFNEDFNI